MWWRKKKEENTYEKKNPFRHFSHNTFFLSPCVDYSPIIIYSNSNFLFIISPSSFRTRTSSNTFSVSLTPTSRVSVRSCTLSLPSRVLVVVTLTWFAKRPMSLLLNGNYTSLSTIFLHFCIDFFFFMSSVPVSSLTMNSNVSSPSCKTPPSTRSPTGSLTDKRIARTVNTLTLSLTPLTTNSVKILSA